MGMIYTRRVIINQSRVRIRSCVLRRWSSCLRAALMPSLWRRCSVRAGSWSPAAWRYWSSPEATVKGQLWSVKHVTQRFSHRPGKSGDAIDCITCDVHNPSCVKGGYSTYPVYWARSHCVFGGDAKLCGAAARCPRQLSAEFRFGINLRRQHMPNISFVFHTINEPA